MNDGRMLVRDPDGQSEEEEKNKKTTTTIIDRSNQPKTMDLLTSGKRSDIEQGLYNMRIEASKGSGKSMSDWVGNKKHAKDVDLIMEHGLHNVTIEGGKVTLKEAYKASLMPVDINSVTKDISKSASYEEGSGGGTVLIVENSSNNGNQQTESGSTVVVAGGGSDDGSADALYKGG